MGGRARALRRDLCAALEAFEPLQRSWELVWGPATFRPALDLVPRAWSAPSLLDALDLYRPGVDDPPGLAGLAALIAEQVGGLAYQHVTGQERVFRGRLAADARTYPEQLVHQHLEAHIEELGFAPWLTRQRLFGVG